MTNPTPPLPDEELDAEGLRAAHLNGWLKHAEDCEWADETDDCTCGLAAALTAPLPDEELVAIIDRLFRSIDKIKPEPGMNGPHGGHRGGPTLEYAVSAMEDAAAALRAERAAREPHPGDHHEFRMVCLRCGEPGTLHVAFITPGERVEVHEAALAPATGEGAESERRERQRRGARLAVSTIGPRGHEKVWPTAPLPDHRCPYCRESVSGVCTQHNGISVQSSTEIERLAPLPDEELDAIIDSLPSWTADNGIKMVSRTGALAALHAERAARARVEYALRDVLPRLDHWPRNVQGSGWNPITEPHSADCPPCALRAVLVPATGEGASDE